MLAKNDNGCEKKKPAESIDAIVGTERSPDEIIAIADVERRGYVAVGQPYDGGQRYICVLGDNPKITDCPYQDRP